MILSRKPDLRVVTGSPAEKPKNGKGSGTPLGENDPQAVEAARLDLASRLYDADEDVRQLRLREGESVLVLAAGTGLVARHVARAVGATGRVTAIDLNPVCLEHARYAAHDEGLANIGFRRGGLPRLPFADASFDAVFARHAIDPASGRVRVAECARVLRPGGRLVVSQLALFPPEYAPAGASFARAFRGCGARALAGTTFDTRGQRHLPGWMLASGLVDVRVATFDDPAFGGFGGELARAWHWEQWWAAYFPRWVAVTGERGAAALRERHLELVDDPAVFAMCVSSYVAGRKPEMSMAADLP